MCKLKSFTRRELVLHISSVLGISRTKAREIDRRTVDAVTGKFFQLGDLRWIVQHGGDFFFVNSKNINTALRRGAHKVDYRMSNTRLESFLNRLSQSDSAIRTTIPVPVSEGFKNPRKKQHRRFSSKRFILSF